MQSTVSWATGKAEGWWSSWFLDVQGLSPANYKVLAEISDPVNGIALTYLCRDAWFGLARNEYVHYLSRQPIMSEPMITHFNDVLGTIYPTFDQVLGLVKTTQGSTCIYPATTT